MWDGEHLYSAGKKTDCLFCELIAAMLAVGAANRDERSLSSQPPAVTRLSVTRHAHRDPCATWHPSSESPYCSLDAATLLAHHAVPLRAHSCGGHAHNGVSTMPPSSSPPLTQQLRALATRFGASGRYAPGSRSTNHS